jgi:hypothetical protein
LGIFLNDFEMVPVAPYITGITFVFTINMTSISIAWHFYIFLILPASFLITLLSPEIPTSLFIIMDYDGLVYCQGWFCQFALVGSKIQLVYLHNLFLLILVHAYTIVYCLILPISLEM